MTKVINLFGAPGSGKSTLAAGLFYNLKLKHYKCELVTEWIKEKVFDGTQYPFKDQLYTFAKQHKKIKQLIGQVDYIICDSPLLQSLIYGVNEFPSFEPMVLEYFNSYDNINYLLCRTHEYETYGRVHSVDQALEIQKQIQETLLKYSVKFETLETHNALDNILSIFEELDI